MGQDQHGRHVGWTTSDGRIPKAVTLLALAVFTVAIGYLLLHCIGYDILMY